MSLHVVQHPVVEDTLAALRDRRTPPAEFRALARRVSLLVIAEATSALPTREAEIETPLETTVVRRLATVRADGILLSPTLPARRCTLPPS